MNVNDWQTIQSRKEIQNIKKQMKSGKLTDWTLILEIALAIISFSLNNIYSEEQANGLWITVSIIAIMIPLIIFFVDVIIKKIKIEQNKLVRDQHEIINLYDDEICYNVITAESLYSSLQSKISDFGKGNLTTTQKETLLFYFIEISYYLNKSVRLIGTMKNNIENLIANPNSTVIERVNIISFSRFKNTVLLISELYESLESVQLDNERLLEIEEENEFYRSMLTEVTKTIKNEYKIDIFSINNTEV